MVSMTGGVTLFTQTRPELLLMSSLYIPTNTPPTGNIIPVVGSLVVDVDNNNDIWVVDAVNPTTHVSTLAPARLFVSNANPNDSLTSIISYGNDIFRLYYDPRTSPMVARPDTRIVVFGTDNVKYQIVQNPGSTQVVLSENYNSSGAYTGVTAPLAPVVSADGDATFSGASYLTPCYLTAPPTPGEEYFIQVFNSQGAQTAQISVFAQPSIIINEAITPDPVITGIALLSTQSRSNNEIYIFQNQNVDSLGIQVQLTYSDGHTRIVPIDNVQCFLYGVTDFVPSYPGLQQTILAKYYLGPSDGISSELAATNTVFITAEASLVVISNELQAGVKISVIPHWNAGLSRYDLSYFLYTTTRTAAINVTSLVTISSGTPYNGSLYGVEQNLTLQLDMSLAIPASYSVSTIYQQTCIIKLQPIAAYERYILKDATGAPLCFGADSTNNRRAVVHYDATLQQYYIPSLFAALPAMLLSFFTDANPPYDTTTETQPPTPTHFLLRDPISGIMLTAAMIPLTAYNAAFSIIGAGLTNRYAGFGSNVIVEMIAVVGSTSLILYGVPCDCYVGTYNG